MKDKKVEDASREISRRFEECKSALMKFFLDSPDIPITTGNCLVDVNDAVRDYLLETGHKEWLAHDVSYGHQFGGVSAGVLCDFVRRGTVFDGMSGRFTLKEKYAVHSARYFEAWRAENESK